MLTQHLAEWRGNKQMAPVRQMLQSEWQAKHTLLDQNDSPKIEDTGPQEPQQGRCLKYGFCLCKGEGFLAYIFHCNLASHMQARSITRRAPHRDNKHTKPPKTRARLLLESTQVCLKLEAQATAEQQLQALMDATDDEADASGLQVPKEVWLHINYINFRDMHFSFLKMVMDPKKQSPGSATLLEVQPGPLAGAVLRSCVFLAQLDLNYEWRASWHQIICDDATVPDAEFLPRFVQVRPLDSEILPPLKVWRGPEPETQAFRDKQKKKSGQPRPRPRGQKRKQGASSAAAVRKRQASQKHQRGSAIKDTGGPSATEADEDVQNEGPDDMSGDESLPDLEELELDDAVQQSTAGPTNAMELEESQLLAELASCIAEDAPQSAAAAVPPAAAAAAAAESAAPNEPIPEGPAAVPPVPPPAPVPRVRHGAEDVFPIQLDGEYLGTLRYNARFKTLTAHCECHKEESCRKQRTVVAGRKAGQGRPIGYLLAWLMDGKNHRNASHHGRDADSACNWEQRDRLRTRFLTLPGGCEFAQHERERAADESAEPRKIK